jgi:hypothetical protein
MTRGAAAGGSRGEETDRLRLQQYRLRLERVMAMLQEREAAHRARGSAPQALKDAIRGFALELRRVRSRLSALDAGQRA